MRRLDLRIMLETKFEETTPIQLKETKGLIIDFLVIQRVILIFIHLVLAITVNYIFFHERLRR
jgi:hypothetical protein